jgi:hypothetical protein
MAEDRPTDEQTADEQTTDDLAGDELPALEQWPEDEGSAPHARPDTPSVLRLLLRGAPRVTLAFLLAVAYAAAEGATRVAFLLSWIVVVGSMLLPGWRRYVETGSRKKPPKPQPVAANPGADRGAEPDPQVATGQASQAGGEPEAEIDPRDAWEVPEDLPADLTEKKPKPEST